MPEVELPNPEELDELRDKAFTRRTALLTAVYAVFLAVVSLGGNNAAKEMSLSQQEASDQWDFYQAKSMREQMYHIESLRLQDELAAAAEPGGASLAHKRQFLQTVTAEEARYAGEKKQIEEKARELERERDRYRARDPYFDFGEVLLQIAIVLASMSILTRARPVFHASLVAAILGALLGLNGFLLLFHLPLL